ncbi:MAG: DNA topoisomerase IV subunit A [Alphaproteobacteria bacterium]|jgi:topoisomerase-4 subunit A|nr:DNA topoisomerase IV subunit A [Alphaproteobacteria bacterium]
MINEIKTIQLAEALSEKYLEYAMSTIVSRSLPDVRDGLKPVHRRLLFAMRALRLAPQSGFKKSARVVGDVIGKYHPHGDTAVYDSMVRLAQDFSVRFPLVDGQGNFGNVDGDSPAAMRYTEARLTEIAIKLMEGLDEDAVDFVPTYDGEHNEPSVMPGCFPNLLANGAMGIAVGMATNIPPHNVDEVCAALLYLIKHKEATTKQLTKYIKGPDFPTGGIVCENHDTISRIYEEGKGAIKLRCKWEKEELGRGAYQIAITEIPYQVQKSRLIEKTAELINNGKLNTVADIRDESDENVRIIIEPKSRIIEAEKLMAQLLQNTDFEIKFNYNMNALDSKGVPRVMPLREFLQEFIDHQQVVLVRRSKYKLDKIEHRLEILNGLLIAYLNLDEIINIIRNNDEPKPLLMDRFSLSDVQAEAILNMKLRQLRKLEENEILENKKMLEAERDHLKEILDSEELQLQTVATDIEETKVKFGKKTKVGKRKTKIDNEAETLSYNEADFVVREPLSIIISEKGWIKALKGHVDLTQDFAFKDGDKLGFAIHSNSAHKLLIFADNGRFYTIDPAKLPRGRGFGEPINLMIELKTAKIVQIFDYNDKTDEEKEILLASKSGNGFKTPIAETIASTKNGKTVMGLKTGDTPVVAKIIEKDDDLIAITGNNRMLLIFDINELPTLGKGKGVILQKYKEKKTHLSDVISFKSLEGFSWASGSKTYSVKPADVEMWKNNRAKVGKMVPYGFPKNNKF